MLCRNPRVLSVGFSTPCFPVVPIPSCLIMATPPRSTEQTLQEMLRQARAEGRSDELLQIIQSSFATSDVQGMSDAPKRQRSSVTTSGWEDAVIIPDAGTTKKGPTSSGMAPSTATSSTTQGVILPNDAPRAALPPGIRDVDQWGATICELPKVKAKNACYTDLVNMAFSDPELMTYLTRFVLKHNGPSPKVRDLRLYLEYINFPNNFEGRARTGTYVMPRQFKQGV